MFQSKCCENKVEWVDVREILFEYKKHSDQKARNMLWHFRERACEKCVYWDDVYKRHIADVKPECSQGEVTDEEMVQAAMEVDGSHQKA